MKLLKTQLVILAWFISFLVAGCEKDDGSKTRPNIFEQEGSAVMKLSHVSNADTVFLTWKLLDKDVKFDHYQVSNLKNSENLKVDKKETGCYLVKVPYNEPFSLSVSLVSNEKAVVTLPLSVRINGLDTVLAQIIVPDRGSVTGGDGTYSIDLKDGRSLFLMGDSFIGPVTNGARSMSDHMFRNTYILYDNGKVSALYGVNGEKTSAAVPPGVTNEHQKWYWPGHGFVKDGRLFVFQTLMYQGEAGMWGFRYETTDILEYSLPSIELVKTTRIPFEGSTDIHYGMAVHEDGDFIYIYAQADVDNSWNPVSDALVARTTIGNLYTRWEYYNGSGWSANSADAVKMAGLSSVAISSQFNVFKLNGKYVLLSQDKRFNSGEIYTFISDTPHGPWYNKQLVYKIQDGNKPGLFTYNAMAHPQFQKDGMILISYNINNEDFVKQHEDVSTYRPRFLWVEISKILGN